jgi:hypothetical protein
MKYFITYCDFPKGHKARDTYELHTRPRFIKYCEKHEFIFTEISTNLASPYNLGFAKVFWIKQNMDKLQDGDIVTYMDIDCCIMDGTKDAVFDKDVSVVMESTGVLCMGGAWSIRISEWSRKFIDAMCSDELQKKNKDLQSWNTWHENDAIYHILGIEWGQGFESIGTRNTTPFTREELIEHTQLLPVNWGVTFHPDDTPMDDKCFWIYKIIAKYFKPERFCDYDDIIVRHLSAGTMYEEWANKYYNKEMKV